MSELPPQSMTPRAQTGMTLIELMVALAIGSFLMIGAMTVFMQSRTTFRLTESVSRLQETARFAMDAIEPEIRMAQYWGFVSRGELVLNRRAPTDPAGIGPNTCGNNWTINLNQAVQGTNNGYNWACAPNALAPVEANSDTLVVRRAGDDLVIPPNPAGQIAIVSSRFNGTLYNVAATPAGYDVAGGRAEIHRLMVSGYYVQRQNPPSRPQPILRRKVLGTNGQITDEEVIPGVEDMQVQFGLDLDPPGGLNRGSVDRYVNPNDPLIDPTNAGYNPNAEILAVRVWLRVRAERPENGFTDTTNYVYADQNVGPFNDNFRRMLVTKTIYLRNNRPPDY